VSVCERGRALSKRSSCKADLQKNFA